MTTSEVPRRAIVAAVAFIVVSIVEFVMALVTGFLLILEQMVFIGCGTETGEDPACDSDLGTNAMFAAWAAMALVLIATIVIGIALARRGRTYWWLPVVGIVINVGAIALAEMVINIASNHRLF